VKTYTIIFAEDVPHYGSVEIAAANDADAVVQATAYWNRAKNSQEPWPLDDAEYGSAILERIIEITDSDERPVANDIRLDSYYLATARTERHARLIDNAAYMAEVLKRIAACDIDQLDTNDAEHDALCDAVETARAVIAKIEGDSSNAIL
jgi:hypothetical protein